MAVEAQKMDRRRRPHHQQLPSDSGAFADWVASSSSSAGDLSLGFNAGPTAPAAANSSAAGMWSSAAATRHINCGLPPEFFFVAPASSFQHHHPEAAAAGATTTINFDPHSLNASNAIGVGVGVIPLLTATPCLAQSGIGGSGGGSSAAAADEDVLNNSRHRGGGGGGMQLWQHQQGQNSPANYLKKPIIVDHTNLLQSGNGGGSTSGGIGGSSSMGATTCQDCGNQAKKDCPHRRCRTCCRSRGYDCTTHVKSTWVPAARRRERQLMAPNTATAGSSQSTSGAKKPRLSGTSQTTSHTSTSNTTPPRSFDTSSSHQDASFKESLPGQVRAPAVFKCVRVTALDDGEDEYAYQAVVRIGGHVFKGFLYDQGFDGNRGDGGFPNISELHLGGSGSAGGGGGGGRNGSSSSPPVLDPSDMYASSGGGLLAGSTYGNPIN
ncbi:protein LATERAL ROOT PRIMORDIUM 1 [Sesamum alatum]|uniref:Protein LATERAL ROOT PRIMORDIUM 1 n=1 Tax=Sesamum alatum TaxID=300844 RepID=A0AAE1XY46_9LAMI|nr:protein LATERAL ROOT PRIMORDIUM 1 [Sesamum alatum]